MYEHMNIHTCTVCTMQRRHAGMEIQIDSNPNVSPNAIVTWLTNSSLSLKPVKQTTAPSIVHEYTGRTELGSGYTHTYVHTDREIETVLASHALGCN